MVSPMRCSLWFICGLIMVTESTHCPGREVICMEQPPVDTIGLREVTMDESGDWIPDRDSATNEITAGYVSDEYMVSLRGKVEWTSADLVMGDGKPIIGKIENTDYCPTYTAIFSVTNLYGLMCSIEISKPLTTIDGVELGYCTITLKSWSISLLYFDTNDQDFWYVSNLQIFKGAGAEPTNLILSSVDVYGNAISTLSLSEDAGLLFHLNLDGITYVRSAALTYMYADPDTTTTAEPTTTQARRRRQLDLESANSQQGEQQYMTDFLSSVPASNITLLGFSIGITVFLSQALLSKKNAK